MNEEKYRKKTYQILTGFLNGSINEQEAYKQALDIIRSKDWEKLPSYITDAVHLLFDLHDESVFWRPKHEELEKAKSTIEQLK